MGKLGDGLLQYDSKEQIFGDFLIIYRFFLFLLGGFEEKAYICILILRIIYMARLIIRNIGPIKNVDIELNKVNVFIGEQSSGKSTIAKIISFCSWLEKP